MANGITLVNYDRKTFIVQATGVMYVDEFSFETNSFGDNLYRLKGLCSDWKQLILQFMKNRCNVFSLEIVMGIICIALRGCVLVDSSYIANYE